MCAIKKDKLIILYTASPTNEAMTSRSSFNPIKSNA